VLGFLPPIGKHILEHKVVENWNEIFDIFNCDDDENKIVKDYV